MSVEHDALVRLVGLTHDATKHVSHRTSVLQLYRAASDVAERRLPGPLGVAVAAVLADQSTMALAVAVQEIVPGEKC